jgi:hypothetical protein
MRFVGDPPTRVQAVDRQLYFTREWRDYLLILQGLAAGSGQILGSDVALEDQHASIGTTPIALPAVSAGFYRVSLYQTITVVDAVSSSLQTTVTWTDLGATKTFTTALMNGNTLATNDSVVRMIHIDNASPISYATVYASNTPNVMRYALGIVVEQL